jgi:hypothetical protein
VNDPGSDVNGWRINWSEIIDHDKFIDDLNSYIRRTVEVIYDMITDHMKEEGHACVVNEGQDSDECANDTSSCVIDLIDKVYGERIWLSNYIEMIAYAVGCHTYASYLIDCLNEIIP